MIHLQIFYVSKPAGTQTLKGNTLGHKDYSTVSWQLLKQLNAPSKRYVFCHTPSALKRKVFIFVTDAVALVCNELKLILGRGCGFLVAQGGNFLLKLTLVSQQTGRCSELRGGRFQR